MKIVDYKADVPRKSPGRKSEATKALIEALEESFETKQAKAFKVQSPEEARKFIHKVRYLAHKLDMGVSAGIDGDMVVFMGKEVKLRKSAVAKA